MSALDIEALLEEVGGIGKIKQEAVEPSRPKSSGGDRRKSEIRERRENDRRREGRDEDTRRGSLDGPEWSGRFRVDSSRGAARNRSRSRSPHDSRHYRPAGRGNRPLELDHRTGREPRIGDPDYGRLRAEWDEDIRLREKEGERFTPLDKVPERADRYAVRGDWSGPRRDRRDQRDRREEERGERGGWRGDRGDRRGDRDDRRGFRDDRRGDIDLAARLKGRDQDGRLERDVDMKMEYRVDTRKDRDMKIRSQADGLKRDSNGDIKIKRDSNGDIKIKRDPNSDVKIKRDPDGDIKIKRDPNRDVKIKRDPDSSPKIKKEPDADVKVKKDPDGDVKMEYEDHWFPKILGEERPGPPDRPPTYIDFTRPPTRERPATREKPPTRERPLDRDSPPAHQRPLLRDEVRPRVERDRDRVDQDRGRERRPPPPDAGRRRSRSPPPPKKVTEPQLTEDERDRRTIFVQQLAARLRSKDLIKFFEDAGPVQEAQIVKDRVSGRSKGVGYVEFKEEESVAKAIKLTGHLLLGIPIIAQHTEAEKNRQVKTTEGADGNTNSIPFHRLYVGNVHFSITEEDLENVFSPFGELEFVQLQKDETGRSRGYGFVQFRDPPAAKSALESMNGFQLANRPIRVGLGNDRFTAESTASMLQRFPAQAAGFTGSAFSGSGGRGTQAGGKGGAYDRAGGRDNDKTGGASALDDTDVAGVNYNNYSRASLMQKLARTDEGASNDEQSKLAQAAKAKAAAAKQQQARPQMATRCVVLKNMFNPAEETGDNWVKELEADVKTECEDKYGHVVHLAVDPNTLGDIYVKFDGVKGGENAIRGLNGRFFGGRTISAQPVVDAVYNSLFSNAK